MVSVDLSLCTADLKGRVHFIYCEYSESDSGSACGLTYQQDKSGKLSILESSMSEFERFRDEVELPESPLPSSWKGDYMAIRRFSEGRKSDRVDSLRRAIRKNDSDAVPISIFRFSCRMAVTTCWACFLKSGD